jgi:hypothetical protein
MVRDTFNLEYSFNTQGEFDHIEIEYRDPQTFQPLYATYPLTGGSYPDTYKLFGCTDQTYAEQFARYLDNVKKRRRKVVSFKTEADGFLVRFGHRIGVASSVPYWGHSGVVVEVVSATEIRVDGPLPWTTNNVMILRDEMGGQLGQYSVTQGADLSTAVFSEAITAHGPIGLDPTNYIFGEDSTLIRDFMVTKVSPDTETTVAIEAQVYDEFIFEGGPPQMNPPPPQEDCAALYTALNETVDHHWPCSDDGNPLIDAIGTYNLPVVTQNPTPYQPSLTNGVCDGVYSMIGSHSDLFDKQNIINIEQGSFGGFFDYTSGGGRGMLLNFGGDSIGIYIKHGPDPETDLTVYLNDMNSGVNQDIEYLGANSPLPDGSSPFIIVNYVVSPLLFKVEVELWSNFTSAGLNTRTIDVTPSGTNTYLWVNDADSADNRVQNVFLNTLPLTEEEILYLKQGYDTNQP